MGLYRVTITKQVERLVEAEHRSDLTGSDVADLLIRAVDKDNTLKSAPVAITVGRGEPEDSDLAPDLVFTTRAHLMPPPTVESPAEDDGSE